MAEAFTVAAERWPVTGVPPNPGGWITTTARNRAIDRLRRESTRSERHLAAHRLHEAQMHPDDDHPELGDLDALHGPGVGLEALAAADSEAVDGYQPFHATRADLLARAGRVEDARAAYDRAIELTTNPAERTFLQGQRERLPRA